jgi:hypothetical protein
MIVQVKEQENMMDDIERDDVSDLEGGVMFLLKLTLGILRFLESLCEK